MRLTIWPLVVILTMGCGDGARGVGDAVVTDSAGIQIVVNPGLDRPPGWGLEPIFTIGGDDSGPTSFTRVSTATVAAGDGVFHLVNEDHQIVSFDSLGRHLRTMGRAGGGPGEIQFPGVLIAGPGGAVSVLDYGKEAIVRFGPDGAVLPLQPLRALGHVWRGLQLRGDTVLATIQTIDSAGAPLVSLKMAAPSDTVDVLSLRLIGKTEMADLGCVKLSGQPPLFTPGLAFDWNGRDVAVARKTEYELAVYAGNRVTRLIRRSIAPMPATTAEVGRLYPDGFKISFGPGGPPPCVVAMETLTKAMGIAAAVPVIDEVRFAPDGVIWARRFAFPKEPGRYDLFSPDGRYLGTVTTEGQLAGFPTASTLVTVVPDSATGGNRLAGFRLTRR